MKKHPIVVTLREILPPAEAGGYAVGSFAPRYLAMIRPVLRAARRANTPIIVQISANEFRWFNTGPAEFTARFFATLDEEQVTTPVVLHLDHTKDPQVIHDAIAAGFTSVMIDRSELPLAENIAATREVVDYAHARGVSVEAELGRIFSSDQIETTEDVELYTSADEARQFVAETGVDALAVSVGNVHVHAGRGVSGENGAQTIRLGSPAFLAESGVAIDGVRLEDVKATGQTIVGVTAWGESARCASPAYEYRLDCPAAQEFLHENLDADCFVSAP